MADSLDILIQNVKRLLADREWDQKDLARRAGMTGAQMSKYMRRVNQPTLSVVDRLAMALKVSVSELVAPKGVLPEARPHRLKDCLREVEEAALRGAQGLLPGQEGKGERPSEPTGGELHRVVDWLLSHPKAGEILEKLSVDARNRARPESTPEDPQAEGR